MKYFCTEIQQLSREGLVPLFELLDESVVFFSLNAILTGKNYWQTNNGYSDLYLAIIFSELNKCACLFKKKTTDGILKMELSGEN